MQGHKKEREWSFIVPNASECKKFKWIQLQYVVFSVSNTNSQHSAKKPNATIKLTKTKYKFTICHMLTKY